VCYGKFGRGRTGQTGNPGLQFLKLVLLAGLGYAGKLL
jgi:hypothetical protein